MKTRRSKAIAATNKLTKEDSDARKLILRNVANGVIGLERRRARNIYPWMTGGMLDHQLMKLKRNQKSKRYSRGCVGGRYQVSRHKIVPL
jgi:hypothetical protein